MTQYHQSYVHVGCYHQTEEFCEYPGSYHAAKGQDCLCFALLKIRNRMRVNLLGFTKKEVFE